ncbi:TIR domain-containing protein [Thermoleptolyngbya sichuanensis A183]|uniref:TIR domain-containing protein n=1 Tax=Thermoleptolyngbya sichuanensis A183 TaxID=2737172 RepID=A0A6M8B9S6_9CYAN|nr:TIR domain-containing protein [Thermoleptolyngbya sichuanensis]QKD80866.1 TIR domain-containing protein [Thermoleptolyngbya sichuanensis A183]
MSDSASGSAAAFSAPSLPDNITGIRMADVLLLPDEQQSVVRWLLRHNVVSLSETAAHFQQTEAEMQAFLLPLLEKRIVRQVEQDGAIAYEVKLAHKSNRRMPRDIWKILDMSSETANVFVSYSRRNRPFVQTLVQALQKRGREVWVDWDSIPSGADWWEEIKLGIEVADTMIFVLSPESAASEVCGRELEHALQHQKRLLPVVCKDVDPALVHPELGKINWIFLRDTDNFEVGFRSLVSALDADLSYVRTHTRLLVRATEWNARGKDRSLLLRGSEIQEARRWLAEGEHKEPQALQVQKEYIWASYNEEMDHQQEELAEQKQILRQQRLLTQTIAAAGAMAIALGIVSFSLYRSAESNRSLAERERLTALTEASGALYGSGQTFEALVKAVEAGFTLNTLKRREQAQNPDVRSRVLSSLQQAIYWVHERNQLRGHAGAVWQAALSPDEQRLASASADGTVRLWQMDGTPVQTLAGDTSQALSVVVLPHERIVSAHDDGSLWFRKPNGTGIRQFAHSQAVNALSAAPNGGAIAAASEDGTVSLWDEAGRRLGTLPSQNTPVRIIAHSPDGKILATGSADGMIRLWQTDGTRWKTIPSGDLAVTSLAFSPNGQILAASRLDGQVRLWRLDGTPVHTFQGHSSPIYSLVFSPTDDLLATASADKTIKLWRLDGTLLSTLGGHTSQVHSLRFSRDGKTLISGSGDRTLRLWRVNHTLLNQLYDHTERVYDVDFSPDGDLIASASGDRTVRLWNRNGQLQKTLAVHTAAVRGVAFSADNQTLASASADRTVKLWNRNGDLLQTLTGHTAAVNEVAFSPSRDQLASASDDGLVRLWQRDGRLVNTLQGHRGSVLSVDYSRDGQMLATAGTDKVVILWTAEGRKLRTLRGHSGKVYHASFSPDGRAIATASYDNTVKLWTPDGTLLVTLEGHSDGVLHVGFSPDGQTLTTASYDGTIKLWTLEGKLISTLRGHRDGVNTAVYSPDGQTLATASNDHTILLWTLTQMNDLEHLLNLGCDLLQDYRHSLPVLEQGRLAECDGT